MATLILSTVGSAVAGPIGSAVGAVVGYGIDQVIFVPKPRHGPRLGDLSVQTSSYGAPIPKLFGTMRVAGTVIWATDLRERRSSSGGGKGRPKLISYTYSADFAVALSARNVRAIHRIWADGKLLRGAAGDFKSQTGFRFYSGDEDQPVDPLIASAEGIADAPAFRGTAYALFEEFQLEDFGNHIPSLTFEVEADAGPVPIGSIARELSGGAVAAGATPPVAGYAATGDSVRSAIEALAEMLPLSLSDAGDVLVLGAPAAPPVSIDADDRSAPTEIVRRAEGSVPAEVSLAYYDPARDYQTGLQRAARGSASQRSDRRSLAAALSADAAKSFAEQRLAALLAARASAKARLRWRRAGVRPGATVTLDGAAAGVWKVDRWLLGPMTVELELTRLPAAAPASAAGTPGRSVGDPDLIHGATALRLYDLPLPVERGGLWLFAMAAGTMAGWRRAALLASFDGGASWSEAGATAGPAVLGHARTALAAGSAAMFDDKSSVEVELLHDGMWLESRSDQALAGGANLAVIGAELIQFGCVDPLGNRRFRLGRLLRGRRGTEWAIAGHAAGDEFALIGAEAIVSLEAPSSAAGSEAQVLASGIGDAQPASANRQIVGETLRPPSPVHLKAMAAANGDLLVQWVRRSRDGWTWPSGSDTPLGEELERYRLTIAGAGRARAVETVQPSYIYTAAERAADGNAGPLALSVVQIGTHAASRPAVAAFA